MFDYISELVALSYEHICLAVPKNVLLSAMSVYV